MRKTVVLLVTLLGFLSGVSQEILPCEDYHTHRRSLENSYLKFTTEKTGRVAFLGGSITYNGGWRDSICAWLEERFPETEFDFVAAGIPSMGSISGAFRFERDVLKNGQVDLLFEEAAVNDQAIGNSHDLIAKSMEGIVRHALTDNPRCDVIMMHFVDPGKMKDYRSGIIPEVIKIHEKIAEHYRVPTLNLAKEVTERIDNGEFTWENDFRNLHPSPFGQGIYSRSMIQFLDHAYNLNFNSKNPKKFKLPKKLDPYCFDAGQLVAPDKSFETMKWEYVSNWNPKDNMGTRANYINVPMLVSSRSYEIYTFPFKGSAVGIAVAAGPTSGILEYCVDGGEWHKIDLFTKHSRRLHLPRYYTLFSELPGKKHKLEMRMSEGRNFNSLGHDCILRYFYIQQ